MSKAKLLQKALDLGLDASEAMTAAELESLIEGVENSEPENYYCPDDAPADTKNEVFQEVTVLRNSTREENGKLITDFRIVEVVRPRVMIRKDQAALLNLVREDPTNRVFSLYLRPGTKKVKDLIRDLKKQ